MQTVVNNKLRYCANTNIATRFELTIFHVIFFQTYKSSIGISLAVAIESSQQLFLLFIVF